MRVVFSTEDAGQFSSAAKGETLENTIKVLCCYRPHIIVLRYDEEGGTKIAAESSSVPIINAGDGVGQHPTQALLDLYTIQNRLGKIDGLSIAMVGDLARGRTVHSLSYLLANFSGVKIYFISPKVVKMRDDIKDYLTRHSVWFTEKNDLRVVAPRVDVVYQTRTQTERGSHIKRYGKEKGFYVVDREVTDAMSKEAIIMHPLPCGDEITADVDSDPRSVYLSTQIENGLFVRMALLKMILS